MELFVDNANEGNNTTKVGITNQHLIKALCPTKGPHNNCYKPMIDPLKLSKN
jgi:hypothetical protein